MADGGSCLLDIAPPPRMAPSGYEDDDIDYYYGDGYVLTVENAYYVYPEVQNLYITNFRYGHTTYIMKVLVNSKGGPNEPINPDLPSVPHIGLKKDVARTPLKQQRMPQDDIKGRTMKVHPNYGVFF